MTLLLTEDYPLPQTALIDAMAGIGDRFSGRALRLIFDRAVATAERLILLPSEKLPHVMDFQKRLARATVSAGVPTRRGVRFNPHITLSYQKGQPFDRSIDSFSWLAEEFVLIHSHVGLTRHDIVARWRLTTQNGDIEQPLLNLS